MHYSLLTGSLLLVLALHLGTASAHLNPYQVKAVFLVNFSKFVRWPESSLKSAHFNICVLGNNPFNVYLDLTVEDTQAYERPVRTQTIQTLTQINDCPILFISTSEHTRISDILAVTSQQDILTVSDIPDFAKLGGCIELHKSNRKISMIINQTSVEQAHLSIRANLLQLSQVIRNDASQKFRKLAATQ